MEFSHSLIEQKKYDIAQRYARKLNKLAFKNSDEMNNVFYLNYILAKENLCDYNIKEAIKIADKTEKKYPASFRYPDEKEELVKSKRQK